MKPIFKSFLLFFKEKIEDKDIRTCNFGPKLEEVHKSHFESVVVFTTDISCKQNKMAVMSSF